MLLGFQSDWRTPANFHGNRYEALVRVKRSTSTPPLDLVSFGAQVERYPASEDFSLQVHFYLPSDPPIAFVQATELDEDLQYLMESKVAWRPKACNVFQPWSSKVALNRIPASNLGVVVRLGGASADVRRFSPAVVVPDVRTATRPEKYVAALRVGPEPIRSVEWSLYRRSDGQLTLVKGDKIQRSYRPATHATIELGTAELKDGWYRLVVHAPFSALAGTADYAFEFYHRAKSCLN